MTGQNWFVSNDGQCNLLKTIPFGENTTHPYRLYRFLTDLEDILDKISDDRLRLQAICPLVRQLLESSSWLQFAFLEPDPQTGWAVQNLYDEPFFPLTVQLVAWTPGAISPIHNHGSWGVVALLNGEEKNTFWQRSPTAKFPDRIQTIRDHLLTPGDILCLMPNAIHQVEAMTPNPTISLNLYGETYHDLRFEFDPILHTAYNF
ncbi:Genome sequencing data, contig C317 [Planktothrix serta PCC 8927]|uniref:Genome sequencing data, contig C317 n=1 Tax=Planktothrix serta PCC 8927 TaxID=671068 RepID=A0A7Z9BS35_9CYAN|nr:cupin domain-containing protein [Planktothrix serta]VXD19708.1 Genome sequencing data, contig C317 [Planktothrix serta PCC 8927]